MANNYDLAALIEPVARHFLGEPNRAMSSPTELRWGTHGSFAVDLTKGVWCDHEANEGGGLLDLIRREVRITERREQFAWLEREGYIINGHPTPHAPPPKEPPPKERPEDNDKAPIGRIVAIYDYVDENGTLLSQVVRFDPKCFRQRCPDPTEPSGFRWNIEGVRRVLYQLPDLLEALASDHRVYIVEGEKDVDAMRARGMPVTTNIGGAGKWRDEYNQTFAGADVVVIADNDPQKVHPRTEQPMVHRDGRPVLPGQDHAAHVAKSLTGIAACVRVLYLGEVWPGCPLKGDISDYFDAGGTVEQINDWVDTLDRSTSAPGSGGHAGSLPCSVGDVLQVFNKWLLLADNRPILAALGTVAANLLDGDPVWTGVIGPPSSAKTEIILSLTGLPYAKSASTLTLPGLLSGTPKPQQHKTAKGGLLREIGDFGILLMKDFGSVLSMRHETKSEVLGALREIYDGSWTRNVGAEGGRTLTWNGKVGFVFGATGAIDEHHAVMSAMGERVLLSRMLPEDGQFERALEHRGAATKQMRKELREAVTRLFDQKLPPPQNISEVETRELADVVNLVVKLRAPVVRDRVSHEITDVYDPEGTARIGLTLERLLAGLDTIGVERTRAMDMIKEIALDSVPRQRRRAFEFLDDGGDPDKGDDTSNYKYHEHDLGLVWCGENLIGWDPKKDEPLLDRDIAAWKAAGSPKPAGSAPTAVGRATSTTKIANHLGLPTNTARRICEDLAAFGLIERISQGKGKRDLWKAK
jgi:hypothetical protein